MTAMKKRLQQQQNHCRGLFHALKCFLNWFCGYFYFLEKVLPMPSNKLFILFLIQSQLPISHTLRSKASNASSRSSLIFKLKTWTSLYLRIFIQLNRFEILPGRFLLAKGKTQWWKRQKTLLRNLVERVSYTAVILH